MTNDKISIASIFPCVGEKSTTRRAEPFVMNVPAGETARWFWVSVENCLEGLPSQRKSALLLEGSGSQKPGSFENTADIAITMASTHDNQIKISRVSMFCLKAPSWFERAARVESHSSRPDDLWILRVDKEILFHFRVVDEVYHPASSSLQQGP